MRTMAPRIAVIGEAIVALMRHPDQREPYLGPFPSGAPCIFASAASRLGCDVAMAMSVGADEFGDLMRSSLAEHGVDLTRAHVDEAHPTSAAFIRYREDGSRTFIFYLEGTAAVRFPMDRVEGFLEEADWLHVSGSTLAFGGEMGEAAERALRHAQEGGIAYSFDPNVRPEAFDAERMERLREHVRGAAIVFASDGELEALQLEPEALVAAGTIVCRKHGRGGASILVDGAWIRVQTPTVEEVDPDGAGDNFAAGFVVAYLVGRDPLRAAEFAVAIASDSVTVHGPMSSRIQPIAELVF